MKNNQALPGLKNHLIAAESFCVGRFHKKISIQQMCYWKPTESACGFLLWDFSECRKHVACAETNRALLAVKLFWPLCQLFPLDCFAIERRLPCGCSCLEEYAADVWVWPGVSGDGREALGDQWLWTWDQVVVAMRASLLPQAPHQI